MTYFTKYLPIEGEVKEKSLVIDMFGRVFPIEKPVAEHKLFSEIISKNGLKPVALFLCSRDIQVGDKVIKEAHPDFGESIILSNDKRVMTLSNGSKTHDHNLIKVIGRISPKATWVKEDDEFEEDQLEFWRNLVWAKHGGFIIDPKMRLDWQKWVTDVKILGPCGHFH